MSFPHLALPLTKSPIFHFDVERFWPRSKMIGNFHIILFLFIRVKIHAKFLVGEHFWGKQWFFSRVGGYGCILLLPYIKSSLDAVMNTEVGKNLWFGGGTILFMKWDFSCKVIQLKLSSLLRLLELSGENIGSIDLSWKIEIVRRFAVCTLGARVHYFLIFIVWGECLGD